MSQVDVQPDLFPSLSVTQWLPGETLFSLVSRHHRLSSNSLARATCLQVFGHPKQGCAHDFPCRLNVFVHRTGTALGTVDTIVHEHTILPYYFPFRRPQDVANALAAVRGSGIGSLKFTLGILTSRFRAHHPLKACPDCMAADRQKWNVAYWHRDHQFPGVWVCSMHGTPLLESTLKSTGVERFGWHLPEHSTLRSAYAVKTEQSVSKIPIFNRLAQSAICLANLPKGFFFLTHRLLQTYASALQSRGLLRGDNGQRKLDEIGPAYLTHVSPLKILPEFDALPNTVTQARTQVSKLLTLPRSGTHPIRHLILIDWLFGSWESFWSSYQNTTISHLDSDDDRIPVVTLREARSAKTDQLLTLLANEGLTISAAAKRLEVDPATAMAWAASAGIATKRRGKILSDEKLAKMIVALGRGAEKAAVARAFDVSISTVTRVLRTEVGLQSRWHKVRHEKAGKRARKKWLTARSNCQHASMKLLRLLEPAAYAWLYRNDRAWLEQQSVAIGKRQDGGNNSNLNWDQRDKALAMAIEHAALEITDQFPGKPISLWQIYQCLPELKAKLSQIHRLPLTNKALIAITAKRLNVRGQGNLA